MADYTVTPAWIAKELLRNLVNMDPAHKTGPAAVRLVGGAYSFDEVRWRDPEKSAVPHMVRLDAFSGLTDIDAIQARIRTEAERILGFLSRVRSGRELMAC